MDVEQPPLGALCATMDKLVRAFDVYLMLAANLVSTVRAAAFKSGFAFSFPLSIH